MKNLAATTNDATEARKLIGQAKDLLSASRVPAHKRLTATESQEAWFLLDKAEGRLHGLLSYVSMLLAKMVSKGRKENC